MQNLNIYLEKMIGEQIADRDIDEALDLLQIVPEIQKQLDDPTASPENKEKIIQKIFPLQIRGLLKLLAAHCQVSELEMLKEEYHTLSAEEKQPLDCVLEYVTEPSDRQLKGIVSFLEEKYPGRVLNLTRKQNENLGSGFILRAGSQEYDWSTKGREALLKKKIDSMELSGKDSLLVQKGIISILRDSLENIDVSGNEVGIVNSVGDGIVYVDGIDHAMYGEVVIFENGQKAMVQDIREDEVGCILFDDEEEIEEGTKAVRSGRMAGIPVGDEFIGRVVNALGAPIDGKGEISASDYRPIEQPAPGIVDRKSVDTPLETGILSIDSMFPIGRGQRELIIGDRQTGKTSIAVDTILNQKGKNVICIYVAIGQKASTVSKLVHTLEKHGAMEYTIVVSSTASDPAPLQYIAPYSGTALAEYFMYRGQDVLIVYDDLSKHAVAYRALSLLLERSPGREAYPGDVFYLHSRLLERSSKLSDTMGGGSITALPIIETQAGDVSAYIPTNVISITDGQIFLESDLFFSGMRPAVNVGLSVSRVGGAAQTKAMKKAAGSIRIDLAQYREMEVFTQFSSDLDAVTMQQLQYGKGLMELLKQPLEHPMSLHEQVITLCSATNKLFLDIPVPKLKEFQGNMLTYMDEKHPEIGNEIEQMKTLSDDLIKRIVSAVKEYKSQVVS
ncbi:MULTISPECIES: F0F1 ATP synthase subunit alpha [Suilimivivens]|uniref:ATP synthase subunit alpha n=1 Tax=Suilimivivens aceti TaxID=2981774 RepID=A0ABT2T0V0_9FIRM|nr:F0F1 ATP synthase subunit alpha [Suilimivivens aceti]MCU6743516.1 F0F1 ATP synthase subunit alpha [Suilimivivens aceti]SCH22399.1 ATP synthase subunit alpha [uncultured Clostridium sp.]